MLNGTVIKLNESVGHIITPDGSFRPDGSFHPEDKLHIVIRRQPSPEQERIPGLAERMCQLAANDSVFLQTAQSIAKSHNGRVIQMTPSSAIVMTEKGSLPPILRPIEKTAENAEAPPVESLPPSPAAKRQANIARIREQLARQQAVAQRPMPPQQQGPAAQRPMPPQQQAAWLAAAQRPMPPPQQAAAQRPMQQQGPAKQPPTSPKNEIGSPSHMNHGAYAF